MFTALAIGFVLFLAALVALPLLLAFGVLALVFRLGIALLMLPVRILGGLLGLTLGLAAGGIALTVGALAFGFAGLVLAAVLLAPLIPVLALGMLAWLVFRRPRSHPASTSSI